MSGWTRIGVVISCLWALFICGSLCLEFIQLEPPKCVVDEKGIVTGNHQGTFLSCNLFSDILRESGNSQIIRYGTQLVEFDLDSFLRVLTYPIILFWVLVFILVKTWRWVSDGFKKQQP